ncbi:unnamed protein product [Diabrotica balteata]|uniref:Uncharacterized protein n=1 Tax=Diabrotica balteata TaxID=107213 RepID=A0A9N9T2M2_DIABA|nr:unnamed protein product [Diabrotica balteata]
MEHKPPPTSGEAPQPNQPKLPTTPQYHPTRPNPPPTTSAKARGKPTQPPTHPTPPTPHANEKPKTRQPANERKSRKPPQGKVCLTECS